MSTRTVQFKQVDVFTPVPFKGNPLAVIFDAEGLSAERMQEIARWTNLSETAFLLPPTDPRADYRVRIFTSAVELQFAGHPTLGSAHALIDAGYTPKTPGRLVQECGVGLVTLAERDDGEWAFAAPPATIVPLTDAQNERLAAALAPAVIDFSAPPDAVDNGAPWLVVRVRDAVQCLALSVQGHARGARCGNGHARHRRLRTHCLRRSGERRAGVDRWLFNHGDRRRILHLTQDPRAS